MVSWRLTHGVKTDWFLTQQFSQNWQILVQMVQTFFDVIVIWLFYLIYFS
jgi:hypothetical protein